METAVKLTPEIIEAETESLTIPEQAKALKIVDAQTYTRAGAFWKEIRALRAKVADSFDPLIKHAHNLHKATLAKKGEIDKPLEDSERFVKAMMSAYDAEQERIRKAEQDRLAAIARKAEEERLLAEAAAAEAEARANGATKEEAAQVADAVIAEPIYVPPIVIPKATPKLSGGPVFQKRWTFEIVNEALIPRQYLSVDEVKIGKIVTAMKEQTNIPGIRAFERRV